MRVRIYIKPRARESKVVENENGHFTVWVVSLPEKGKANLELTETLAQYFKVSPSRVSIVSGFSSREKLVEIN